MRQAQPHADFGVVIPAKAEHLHWVRGTCASVRHFMGDTPICVLLDGEGSLDDIRETYGLTVLHSADVEPPELRELSFGSLKAKNSALWASPFERYLLLDADTIVWGDMREHADFDGFDFLLDRGGLPPDDVRDWIMDVDAVERHFPGFGARRHVSRYVNNGAYLGRRNMLDVEHYLDLVRFSRTHPGVFYGSQGLLNFMLFEASDQGVLSIEQRELQVMTGRMNRHELAARFPFEDDRPLVLGAPVVLHWVDAPKPSVRERGEDYFEPMTHFRREFRRATRGGRAAPSDLLWLRLEDTLATDWRGRNLRGRYAKLRRRARQRWARWKAALRSRAPERAVTALKRRRPSPPAG